MKYEDFTMIGEPTLEESQFTNFLLEGIAVYVSNKKVDRRVLIAALSQIAKIVFCNQTPLNVKDQCKEIDSFCEFLKIYALKDVACEN